MNGIRRNYSWIWALALAMPAVAPASVIYTNLGAGQSYDTTGGNPVGNGLDFSGSNYAEGESFTPAANANFGQLFVALSCSTGCPASDNFTISLDSDSSGMPGSAIESFIFTGKTLNSLGLNNTLISATSVLKPLLTSGTQYWITVTSSLADAITWNWNSTGDVNSQAISTDGGASWFAPSGLTPGAFEVDTAAITGVPEPGALGLVTLGLLTGLGILRRKTNR